MSGTTGNGAPAAGSYLEYYQGDSWIFIVSLTNPDGSAQNLTETSPNLIILYGESGAQAQTICVIAPTADPLTNLTTGNIKFVVPSSFTTNIPADPGLLPTGYFFPTRARLVLTDTSGNPETQGVIPVNVLGA